MLTKERFKDLVYMMFKHNELYDKLHDLGIDVVECEYLEIADVFFSELMKAEFGEEGLDLISWWMYEDVDHKLYEPGSEGKKVIADLNNIEDLYDYLTDQA